MPAEWCGIGRDAGLECIGEPPETDRQRGADRKCFLRIYSGDPSSGSLLTFSATEVGMSSLPRPSAMSLLLFVARLCILLNW